MKKSVLRAECTMLADEGDEARAAATRLSDDVDMWADFAETLASDVKHLARENDRLRRIIRLLTKSL